MCTCTCRYDATTRPPLVQGHRAGRCGMDERLVFFCFCLFLVFDSFFSNFVPIICDTRGRGESVRLYAITGEMGKERGKGEGAGRKNMTSTDAVDVAGVWDKRPLLRIDGEGSSVGPVATIGNNLLMRRV